MEGSFVRDVIQLSGLPEDQVMAWLEKELEARGKFLADLDPEVLRDLLMEMIQELTLTN